MNFTNGDLWDTAASYLGRSGKMLSGSKTAPEGQKVIWNGNIVTENGVKIWYGDINITTQGQALQNLANALGEKIYVLYEMDARFDNETNPKIENSVACFPVQDDAARLAARERVLAEGGSLVLGPDNNFEPQS